MLRLMSMLFAMASAISGMVLLSGVAASAQTSVPLHRLARRSRHFPCARTWCSCPRW